jgi:hypothetical protein
VRLQRWGAVTGRLVGPDGKGLAGVRVRLTYPELPNPGMRPPDGDVATNGEGRFRVEGLLPGLAHELTLDGAKLRAALSAGDRLKGLSAGAGEVKDLGDVRVKVTPAK